MSFKLEHEIDGKTKEIGIYDTREDALKYIYEYEKKKGKKLDYTRHWEVNHVEHIDYGYYNAFFKIRRV